MKILVPVKRVVDYNVKVRVKADQSGMDLANVKMSMNPFDEIAVEEAVRLKEKGVVTEVIAVSLRRHAVPGNPAHRHGHRRRPRHPGGNHRRVAAPWPWPSCSKALMDKEQPGLVILGKQAIDDDCNQTRPDARRAGGSAAKAPSPTRSRWKDRRLGARSNVTREVDGGLETLSLTLPAIITTDLRLNEPRYVTLPNIMKAKKKTLDIVKPEDLGVDVSPRLKTLKVCEPPKRGAGIKVADVAAPGGQTQERSQGDLSQRPEQRTGTQNMTALVIAEHDNAP